MSLFERKEQEAALHAHDPAKVKEIDRHQLLQNPKTEAVSAQLALDLGKQLLGKIDTFATKNGIAFTSEHFPKQKTLQNLRNRGNERFLAKLLLGATNDKIFLATGKVVSLSTDALGVPFDTIELQILPVSLAMLEKGKHEAHSQNIRLLAAASLSASAFPESLREGLETTQCSTKSRTVSGVTPDHAAPLAAAFEHIIDRSNTLSTLQLATRNLDPTLADLTHVHGVSARPASQVALHATQSGLASGLELVTLQLPSIPGKYMVHVEARTNELGQSEVITLPEMFPEIRSQEMAAQLSAGLAFAARIIGNDQVEQGVEQTFQARNAEVPMHQLLRKIR